MWCPAITHPGFNPSQLQSIPAPAHGHGEKLSGRGHGHHSGTGRGSAGARESRVSPGVLRPTVPSSDLPLPTRGPARPSRRHRDLSLVLSAAAATPSGTGGGSGESIAGAARDTDTGSSGAQTRDGPRTARGWPRPAEPRGLRGRAEPCPVRRLLRGDRKSVV